MYAWIWRKLPFTQLWGKLACALVLIGGVTALLWMFVFPAVEPMLTPFDDVQVGDPAGGYTDDFGPGNVVVTPSGDPSDHDISYPTAEPSTPSPSPSKRR